MSEVSIPEEAIEKAARAWYEQHTEGFTPVDWDHPAIRKGRPNELRRAAAALEAAAPLIVASYLGELIEWVDSQTAKSHGGAFDAMSEMSLVLRRRASVLRGEGQTHD